MIQVTLKSEEATNELLAIMKGKNGVTLNVSDEMAAKFFEIAMKKQLLNDVEFGSGLGKGQKEPAVKVEKTMQNKKRNTGLTDEIKKVFEENPHEEMTSIDIRDKIQCKGKGNVNSILYNLVRSGYLKKKVVEGISVYKKAEN